MKAQLFRGDLHYAGVTLHTAASGPVTALDTLWLRLEDRGVTGIGEVRLNIRYLHGYREEQVLNNLLQHLNGWDWRRRPRRNLPRCMRRTARCCRRRAWCWIWRCTICWRVRRGQRRRLAGGASWPARLAHQSDAVLGQRVSGCWRRRNAMSIAVSPS
jgi:hypothetical protein